MPTFEEIFNDCVWVVSNEPFGEKKQRAFEDKNKALKCAEGIVGNNSYAEAFKDDHTV